LYKGEGRGEAEREEEEGGGEGKELKPYFKTHLQKEH
jgi:hypothetical protein